MDKIIISPSKYIQGEGALHNIGQYVSTYGKQPLVIADDFVMGLTQATVEASFNDQAVDFDVFNGECSRDEINRLIDKTGSVNADVIIGIGGGKTLDTAKAVAFYSKLPVVIVPTIASTDAPTSALAVIYTPEGEFSEYLMFPSNPNMVIMDTAIIAAAPVRLIVAGMGDALSTWFEARANMHSGKATMAGGAPTRAAQALAKLCFETLLADGLKAKVAVENKVSTKAVENIIEANTYLSGLGFESSGLAAAHAIHNGLTKLEECHHLLHGEKVAFGTLTQLVLENAPLEEITQVIDFCKSIGLPTNLTDMGVKEINRDKLLSVAEASCADGETIHNMPFPVSAQAVLSAMLTAHQLGS
ncbi:MULTISPECIES: glycerol dehydrogenase [unclassified Agarivorans]|uniref:glycerol dehydrogenase n=1 Tax=unclassified Agarivorans TaxID=2636026 RepID=UPI0010EB2296|nr:MULTISPECIES: glycerol dehydrogenase [unclassified Agarivorans]MDO6683880.1 glycerol dehydrogenase [Agarivorans sp. 3_MG-2023]MDO6714387.1 glycerol dehydrogenase [Agarivorans sp. 2_MG-2023]MDO6762380.1 glycerol dehydrogenase [Agarivorans sp. 1_MG-2023]GDY25083.1 glycerol dehydrogenase [Agarivorans sp. Toyoura001]